MPDREKEKMAELDLEGLNGLKRSHYCGTIRLEDAQKDVVLMGWVDKCRNLGGLVFIDLRDRSGIVQCAINQETAPEAFQKAGSLRNEFVIAIEGTVAPRAVPSTNVTLATKDVEIKYTGGVDKLDLKFAITRVTNTKDETVEAFYVGQTAQFTVALTDYEKGKDPTGNIMVTDGDSSCTMTLPKTTCSMVMKHAGTRTVTAVYSGDDTYNKKTATTRVRVRDKRDLTLEIIKITDEKGKSQDTYVVGQNVLYTVRLRRFNTSILPTGTVKLSDGTSTCTVNVGAPDEQGRIIGTCSMAPKAAGTLKITADYSGDEVYNAAQAESAIEVAAKRDITFEIVSITNENNEEQDYYTLGQNVRVTVALSDYEAGLDPTGTFLISDGDSSCTASYPVVSCMIVPKRTGERTVTAIYSGDGNYVSRKDTGTFEVREKIPTSLMINKAIKNGEKNANLTVTLKAETDSPSDQRPAGKITFKSDANANNSTTVCVFVLDTLQFENCSGEINKDDIVYIYDDDKNFVSAQYPIKNMTVNTVLGDSVIAEYSGDVLYGPSVSKTAEFGFITKADTELELSDAYKSAETLLNYTAVLKWDLPETDEEEKPVPNGTVTFKIGTDSCKFTFDGAQMSLNGSEPKDIDKSSFSCSGENTKIKLVERKDPEGDEGGYFKWDFERVVLSSVTADRIQADYSGDKYFNSSSSLIVMFEKIPTSIMIDKAVKSAEKITDLIVTLKAEDEAPSGQNPSGKITFKSDANANNSTTVCTLVLDTLDAPKFENCSGNVNKVEIVDDDRFQTATLYITEMTVNTVLGDSIIAQYSGDVLYGASASEAVKFTPKIKTSLNLSNAYKLDELHAFFNSELSWAEEHPDGKQPSGTITYIMSTSESVDLGKCVYDIAEQTLSCDGRHEAEDPSKPYIFTITDMLVAGHSDRIRAEYSGDIYFESSSSTQILFDKNPTTNTYLEIKDAYKSAEDLANYTATLKWDPTETADGEKPVPTGTVTFKIGSESCKLTFDKSNMPIAEGEELDARLPDGKLVRFYVERVQPQLMSAALRLVDGADGCSGTTQGVQAFEVQEIADRMPELWLFQFLPKPQKMERAAAENGTETLCRCDAVRQF